MKNQVEKNLIPELYKVTFSQIKTVIKGSK